MGLFDETFIEVTITKSVETMVKQQDDEKRISNLSSNVCLAPHDMHTQISPQSKKRNGNENKKLLYKIL